MACGLRVQWPSCPPTAGGTLKGMGRFATTTHTLRPVLAGIGIRADGLAVVDVAAAEAAVRGLPLRLVRARSQTPPPDHLPVGEVRRRVADGYPDLAVSTAIRAGDPASVLIDEARRAELVVVGRRRTGTADGVARCVASRADCPVIVPAGLPA